MAKIALERFECSAEFLPKLCMRCGEATEATKPITFVSTDSSPLKFLLIFAGPLGHAALLLIPSETRERRVEVPACQSHWDHAKKNQKFVIAACFAIMGLILLFSFLYNEMNVNEPLYIIPFAVVILAILTGVLVQSYRQVYCEQITERKIYLAGVHPDFARELAERQAEFGNAFREWKARQKNGNDDGELSIS